METFNDKLKELIELSGLDSESFKGKNEMDIFYAITKKTLEDKKHIEEQNLELKKENAEHKNLYIKSHSGDLNNLLAFIDEKYEGETPAETIKAMITSIAHNNKAEYHDFIKFFYKITSDSKTNNETLGKYQSELDDLKKKFENVTKENEDYQSKYKQFENNKITENDSAGEGNSKHVFGNAPGFNPSQVNERAEQNQVSVQASRNQRKKRAERNEAQNSLSDFLDNKLRKRSSPY